MMNKTAKENFTRREGCDAPPNNAMHPTALGSAVINLVWPRLACVSSPGGG